MIITSTIAWALLINMLLVIKTRLNYRLSKCGQEQYWNGWQNYEVFKTVGHCRVRVLSHEAQLFYFLRVLFCLQYGNYLLFFTFQQALTKGIEQIFIDSKQGPFAALSMRNILSSIRYFDQHPHNIRGYKFTFKQFQLFEHYKQNLRRAHLTLFKALTGAEC